MYKILKFKRTRIVAMLMALLMVLPMVAVLTPAEAKPPHHAKAWGYRSKQKREYRRTWSSNRNRRSSWQSNSWDRRNQYRQSRPTYQRRYQTRYRTRYNRYGQPYRSYYRVYY